MADPAFVGAWDDGTPKRMDATCGWCGKAVEMERLSPSVLFGRTEYHMGPETVTAGALYVCPRSQCHRPSLLAISFYDEYGKLWSPSIRFQLPRGVAQPMDGLPEEIESVRSEAWSSYFGGDFRAALVVGRAAVQRAVRSLGGEGRDLYTEIDSLRERGVVTEELKEWAHEVRIAARDAAHPEELGEVTAEETHTSLKWSDSFLEFAVALPERRRRAKEESPG
jgi:Domain of unknown function (DUF4145)